ncbi:unnamed protein product, partial [Trichobilharzia regenti]
MQNEKEKANQRIREKKIESKFEVHQKQIINDVSTYSIKLKLTQGQSDRDRRKGDVGVRFINGSGGDGGVVVVVGGGGVGM